MSRRGDILLLQGPLGPFFKDLAIAFSQEGVPTHKINFNGGDAYFSGADHVVDYLDPPDQWGDYLQSYLESYPIRAVFVYGDMRFYHRVAAKICGERGVLFYAFEEGYLRPGYITLEAGGNNANSLFPDVFLKGCKNTSAPPKPLLVGPVHWWQINYGYRYYYMKDAHTRPKKYKKFQGYAHHRPDNGYIERIKWLKSVWRKVYYDITEQHELQNITAQCTGKLFFVPLQVAIDSQILYHSPYGTIETFIEHIIAGFAQSASPEDHILFKHHPMDRGFNHYAKLIDQHIDAHSLQGRVHYLFSPSVHEILDLTTACITINSTVGVEALSKSIPTLMLGEAIAKSCGLTSGQSLVEFFKVPEPADKQGCTHFLEALKVHTQFPGSFYKQRKDTAQYVVSCLIPDIFSP